MAMPSDEWNRRRCTGRGKQIHIDYEALAKAFVSWDCEKQLSVYNPSSRWGRVCEDVRWPNTKNNRVLLRTIWTNNRGNVRDLIVKFTQSHAEDTAKSSSEDSIQVTHDNQQSRKLRINPKKKRYHVFSL